jgi:hypothetical protein
MASKTAPVPSTYSIWSLISDESRRALSEFQKAQHNVELAQRKLKKALAKAG